MKIKLSYFTVILSTEVYKSLRHSELLKAGGLYSPEISHLVLSMIISTHMDSIVLNSIFGFLSPARSDLK